MNDNKPLIIGAVGIGLVLLLTKKSSAAQLPAPLPAPKPQPLPMPKTPKPQAPKPTGTAFTTSDMLDVEANMRKEALANADAARATKDPIYMIAVADGLDAEYGRPVATITAKLRDDARALVSTVKATQATNAEMYKAQATAAPPPPNKGYPTLKKGSNGEDVARLRRLLNAHGANVPISTNFDAGLDTAVRNYQKSAGLVVDGIVGPKTWNALVTT